MNPRPSRNGLVQAGLLALIALIAANGLRQWGSARNDLQVAGMPVPPPAAPAVTLIPTVADRESVAPVATTAPTLPAPAPVRSTPPPVRRAAAPLAGEQRYASTWINVRSARSSQSPVVRVLQPGESVQVDSLAQGWYQVVTADAVEGYADRRLLSEDAPLSR